MDGERQVSTTDHRPPDRSATRAATMAHIAERAGVALSTVSYVLSGKRTVSPEIRERVLAAVEELDYRPHRSARALATRRLAHDRALPSVAAVGAHPRPADVRRRRDPGDERERLRAPPLHLARRSGRHRPPRRDGPGGRRHPDGDTRARPPYRASEGERPSRSRSSAERRTRTASASSISTSAPQSRRASRTSTTSATAASRSSTFRRTSSTPATTRR